MKIILTISIAFVTMCSYGQISIHGKVMDKNSNPLSFATVLLKSTSDSSLVRGTTANSNGMFLMRDLQQKEYILTVSMIGYSPEYQNVTIDYASGSDFFEIILEENAVGLDEVIVSSNKPLVEQRIDRTVINVQENASNAGNSAFEVLLKSPGVDIDRVNNTISLVGKEGVSIMINGKLTRMDGASLFQLLEGMSSANIDKIELFTTPPSNFDAQGNAGVINIVTLKNEERGLSGNYSLNAGYGNKGKFGGSLALNYRSAKLYLYGDVSSNNNFTRQDTEISSSFIEGPNAIGNDLRSARPAYIGMHRLNMGLDYDINAATTVGININGYMSNWDMNASSFSSMSENGIIEKRYIQASHEVNTWKNGSLNLHASHDFDTQRGISIDYDYLNYDNENPTDYSEEIYNASEDLTDNRTYFSRKFTPIEFHVLRVDYSDQVDEKLNVELGLKRTISNFQNDVRFANIIGQSPVDNPVLTDNFIMDETIQAAYFSLNYQISDRMLIKSGLRYEHSNTNLFSDSEGELVSRKRGRSFPTTFLNYELTSNSSIGMSFTRRITRPSFNALAPAYYFFDRNTVLTGNVRLQSVLSNQWKVDYSLKDLTVSVQYTSQENPISWGQPSYAEDGTLVIRAEHIHDRSLLSINLNYSKDLFAWWSSRITFGGYSQKETSPVENQLLEFNRKYFQFNLNQSLKLPKDFSFDLTTKYRSRRQYGSNYSVARGSINVGIQKTFDDRSKLSLSVNDLFDLGSFYRSVSDGNSLGIDYDFLYQSEGNVFRITFSKAFGNKSVKASRRNSGSTEEQNRVN